MGASGGATAAIGISKYLCGCSVVAIAPQLNLKKYSYASEFEEITEINSKDEDEYRRQELCEIIERHKKNRYVIFYNAQCSYDFSIQLPCLCERFGIIPRYGVTQCNNLTLWIYDAVGAPSPHSSFENQTIFRAINLLLREVREVQDNEHLQEKIAIINEMWYERYILLRGNLNKSKEIEELKQKLQKAYAEKSEINAKLKQTYAEKAERGIEIKKLKETVTDKEKEISALTQRVDDYERENAVQKERIADLEKKIDDIENSTSYKVGFGVTKLPRKIKDYMIERSK